MSSERIHSLRWCPIYLEPIPGSGERFTVAVAVAWPESGLVQRVKDFEGLPLPALKMSTRMAEGLLRALEIAVAKHGWKALASSAKLSADLCLGEVREARNANPATVARSALELMSAIHGCLDAKHEGLTLDKLIPLIPETVSSTANQNSAPDNRSYYLECYQTMILASRSDENIHAGVTGRNRFASGCRPRPAREAYHS